MGRATAITVAVGMMLMAGEALSQIAAPPPAGTAPPTSPGKPVPPPPGAPSGESVLIPGIAEFQVSPRAWYLFESFGPRQQNPINSSVTNLSSDEYLLGGASVSARFTSLPDTTFVLTGLYGTNAPARLKTESAGFASTVVDGTLFTGTAASEATFDTRRIDIEFLAQTVIPDTDWAWIAGGRFEHHADTITGGQANFMTSSSVLAGTFTSSTVSPVNETASIGIYTLKGGLAGVVPLTADNRLRLFGNIMAVAGFASPNPGPDFGVVGPDASIGLQYSFSPTITADARYRVMVYFLFDLPRGANPNYVIYQGPMIGVNFKF
jgi:hypothetical protein